MLIRAPLSTLVVSLVSLWILWGSYVRPMWETAREISPKGSFGQVDFIEYWAASRLVAVGRNPYDPAEMRLAQGIQDQNSKPLMMWNPPWTVVLLSPFVRGELAPAARSWLLMNIAMAIAIVLLCARTLQTSSLLSVVVVMATFPPLWETFRLGQVGVFLGLAATLSWWALSRGRYFWAGVFFSLMSIKPHLMLIAAAVLLWHDLRYSRLQLTRGILSGIVALAAVSEILAPGMVRLWLNAMTMGDDLQGAVAAQSWVTATLPSVIRAFAARWFDIQLKGIVYLIPALAALTFVLVAMRRASPFSFREKLPPLVAFSAFLAPFGWFFDQLILFPAMALSACSTPALAVGVNAITAYALVHWVHFHHELFWFPLAVLALCFVNRNGER